MTPTPRHRVLAALTAASLLGLAAPASSTVALASPTTPAAVYTPLPLPLGAALPTTALTATRSSAAAVARVAALTTVSRSKPAGVLACVARGRSAGLAAWPAAVRGRIMAQFRVKSVGGYRPGGGRSDHHRGLALDVMVGKNKALGDRVATWAMRNAKALKISYVIWYQRIWMPGKSWRKMSNRGSLTANHYDHPHLSFKPGRGACPTA